MLAVVGNHEIGDRCELADEFSIEKHIKVISATRDNAGRCNIEFIFIQDFRTVSCHGNQALVFGLRRVVNSLYA